MDRTALAPLDQALEYARRGWPVFSCYEPVAPGSCACKEGAACRNVGKHPRTRHGLKDATTVAAAIQQWWAFAPEANLAIATGKAFGWVLDVDPRHGGRESLESLMQAHGTLPLTLRQRTGGGGRQVVFAWPETGTVQNSSGKLAPGLDVRGEGGYVIWAPSVHTSGASYEVLDDVPIVPAPAWLLALVQGDAPEYRNGHGPQAHTEDQETLYDEGKRNDRLIRVAGALRAVGAAEDATLSALLVENERHCVPPLDEGEVRDVWASSRRYGANPPPPLWVKTVYVSEPEKKNGTVKSTITEPPASLWHGWLGAYRDVMGPTTEAPDAFHLGCALVAAGMVLERTCHVWGAQELFPNFYVALIGASGDPRKDTAMDRAWRATGFPADALRRMGDRPFRPMRNVASAEGLVARLAESPQLIRLSEISLLLKNAKREGTTTIVPTLTEAFDCQDTLDVPTRKDPLQARNPFLSILGGSTAEWFNAEVTTEWIRGGFLGRFLFFEGTAKAPLYRPPPPDPAGLRELQMTLYRARDRMLELAKVNREQSVRIGLSDEADAWLEDWYLEERRRIQTEELGILTKRFPVFVQKIALVLCVLDERSTITRADLEDGRAIVELSRAYLTHESAHWGESADATLGDRMIAYVHAQGCAIPRRIVHQHFGGRVKASVFDGVVKSLLVNGRLLDANRVLKCTHDPEPTPGAAS